MTLERFGCGLQIKLAPGADQTKPGTFSGYGAVFGNIDGGRDLINKGAFRDTLRDWKKRDSLPKMFLQHAGLYGFGPAEDGIPIGKWTSMEEDDTGLLCAGELFALDTQKGKYIYEGLKAGALDGLSIGYIAREVVYGKKPEDPPRTLKKVDLLEVSVVTFPMNDEARIDSVKSIEQIAKFSDAEAWLRDTAGLSRTQALAFVSRLKGLRPSDSESSIEVAAANEDVRGLSDRIKQLITRSSP